MLLLRRAPEPHPPGATSASDSVVTRRTLLVGGASLMFSGCASGTRRSAPASSDGSSGEKLHFSFAGIDGESVDFLSTAGRVTVLLFLTTFDVASHTQAKRLQEAYRLHTPRINAVAVVMEAPRYAHLARSYAEFLGLTYAVAMASPESLAEHPQLRRVTAVPSWIFLDREGKITAAVPGPIEPEALEKLLKSSE